MDVEQLLRAMTPEVYQRLVVAVETGKWGDGSLLSAEQQESAQQAVMLYQSQHNHDAEHMTINTAGEMVWKSKDQLRADFNDTDPQTIIRKKL